jgi:hypothetical protein
MDKVADQKFMLRRRLLDARGAMPAEVRRACEAAAAGRRRGVAEFDVPDGAGCVTEEGKAV